MKFSNMLRDEGYNLPDYFKLSPSASNDNFNIPDTKCNAG